MTTQALARQELFMQQLNLIIETHLSDPEFTVRKLIRAARTSRTDLHRKLISAVGMSTTEYLRYKRLQKAALLLTTRQEWCVCQVAYEVGFQYPSYFTQRFREVFGVCPLSYKGDLVILEHL
jgi:AraC-like DNA-binding protein